MLRHHQSIWIDIICGYMQRKHHVTTPSKYMDRYNLWIYAEETSCSKYMDRYNSWIYAEETSCYDTIKGYG